MASWLTNGANGANDFHRPVVFRGAASEWPIKKRWTKAYLLKTIGHHTTDVSTIPYGYMDGQFTSWHVFDLHTLRVDVHGTNFPWCTPTSPAELVDTINMRVSTVCGRPAWGRWRTQACAVTR